MTLLAGEEFFHLFRTFEHTAFRLEVRESYYEKEQLAQFLAGEPVDLSYMESWLALNVGLRVASRRMERVRVVSRPFSDYTRYGLWLCHYNTQAGSTLCASPIPTSCWVRSRSMIRLRSSSMGSGGTPPGTTPSPTVSL